MVRKKSVLQKKQTKKTAYKRRKCSLSTNLLQEHVSDMCLHKQNTCDLINNNIVIHDLVKMLVSKVCRVESKRKRKGCLIERKKEKQQARKKPIKRIVSQRRWFQKKYHADDGFRFKHILRTSISKSQKYHADPDYRSLQKERVLKRYYANDEIRSRWIKKVRERYQQQHSLIDENKIKQKQRIMRKYLVCKRMKVDPSMSASYMKKLKLFRKYCQAAPDFVCHFCRLTFFANQGKEVNDENSSVKESTNEKTDEHFDVDRLKKKWMCRFCLNKTKRNQMPSRALINNLEICDIPPELKKLNDLENHLIALRLPFMKVINLVSGKLSHKFSQKGTKGPLHCVPSDVEDTIKTLPRPVDKSLVIRLQLKRRLNYKAVWEEQFINPQDVREALIILNKIHPDYKKIDIEDISDDYLVSDSELSKEILNVRCA